MIELPDPAVGRAHNQCGNVLGERPSGVIGHGLLARVSMFRYYGIRRGRTGLV
jgi:hypothetical protein